MTLNFSYIFAISLVLMFIFSNARADQDPNCNQLENVEFVTHDIFNLTDSDTIFLHHWANLLHIKTKQKTLINESAFFLKKCQTLEEDLQELERHLRNEKYIRDALVSSNKSHKIDVQTWDNWSLLPTADFARKGGKNRFAIGIRDRNLLGLGIDTEIEYFSNEQRTGYKLKTQFPLYLKNNINANIRLTNNDDGSSEAVFLQKKFVSFDTKNAYKIGFNNFNQIDTAYDNGVVNKQYIHLQNYLTAHWEWLDQNSESAVLRFGIGYTGEKHAFSNSDEFELTPITSSTVLPTNRSFSYPFVSLEYIQKEYRKLTNLNVINQIEDFNLGWSLAAEIGSDFSNKQASPALIWQSHLLRGYAVFDDAYLFFDASFEGEFYTNNENKNRLLLNIKSEYFYKFNDTWASYFKNTNQFSENQFLDSPVVLGGESGVRGFPLQYRHGKHSTQFTFEARYYPHFNIYKLLELGAAAFIDSGRVFGQSEQSISDTSWMTSVGIGARFFSPHSSEANVIHLDIIKPISSAANVNSVEFRITSKHSF
ncbi:hypothetical protein [uncultured Paraglaciecola sp.]|uniref:hypothetical protein n=1 Tax=uncultured Paraglaciecola sp. TaxID=1765024 RepID=UPI0030DD6573|tara:strand:- start:160647 stop:162257 length:1611 start_codon:yes stop_codon:yes gene_type:complete